MVDPFQLALDTRARTEAAALRTTLRMPRPLKRLVAGRPVRVDGQQLDVDMQVVLRLQRLHEEPSVETLPLPAGRAAVLRQAAVLGGRQPIGQVRHVHVRAVGGERAARLYLPDAALPRTPLLVYLHGGGWGYGGLGSRDALCRHLAERSGVRVLALTYRLAPEHPAPAALDDCLAAYRWVRDNADSLGAVPGRIAVGGDGAGGNLAAVLCLRAREEGVAQPTLQVLICPATDLSRRLPSRERFREDFGLTQGFVERSEAAYTFGVDRHDPYVSPLQSKDLAGLAPAYVLTAGFDPLRDEGEAYANRLSEDGVEVELRRHPGLMHGFVTMVGVSRSARRGVAEIVEQLQRRL